MNNVVRVLGDRFNVKFAGESVQDTNSYVLFKLYENLLLTESERAGNRLNTSREGIQSVDLSKIGCNAGDKREIRS